MAKSTPIGFNQRVQLEWLNEAAELVMSGKNTEEIRAALYNLLADKLSVNNSKPADSGSNRGKTVSILSQIWVTPPSPLGGLHQDGLKLLNRLPNPERLPVHWGMSMAVYPFFGQVAETLGRLLRLQDTVNIAQIQRRMREQLGESETVSRATHRVIRSFVDWGVLAESKQRGIYRATSSLTLTDSEVLAWLFEAVLVATDAKTSMLKVLTDAPSLYPFKFANPATLRLETNPRLEFFYQGLDQKLVSLKG